jgi:adenosine deaminase
MLHLDLHRHLEGSHSATALCDVAQRFEIRTPPFFDAAAGRFRTPAALAAEVAMAGPSDDATLFYRCIVKARAAYVSVAAIGALARAAFREAAADTDGFEMRLSLFSMARTLAEHQQLDWRALPPIELAERFARPILLEVIAARDELAAATGTPMLLRLGLSRTFESEPHYRALAAVVAEHARALVGLDVLGIVAGPDTEPMPPGLLAILERLRVHLPDLTIHAGELAGHASVDRTLELAPRGIGHGVRALESPATLARLARDGVTLEVCPTSNRLLIPTALAALERAHGGQMPLRALQAADVHCVLGSDDPTPMGTSHRAEVEIARAAGVDLARLEADSLRRWTEITGATPAGWVTSS